MMKKYIILIAALMLCGFSSCQREKTVGLDNSVDTRVNELIAGYVKTLKDAPHGWMVSVETSNGYYRFWMEFEQNTADRESEVVTMYTDNTKISDKKLEAEKSTYNFRHMQRPTLVFDTYSYLSIINDPDKTISGASGFNSGLNTDFEFEVVSFRDGIFYMQGRFNKVNAVFRPATEKDKEGVKKGYLMDKLSSIFETLKGKYIYAQDGSTEIVTKISDERSFYQFWYDENVAVPNAEKERFGYGEDGYNYYNVEVDESDDILFPEDMAVGKNTVITGIRNIEMEMEGEEYVRGTGKYITSKGRAIDAEITKLPPSLPLDKIMSPEENLRMFNGAYCNNDVVAATDQGVTKTAIDLVNRFGGYPGLFNMILSSPIYYYFSKMTIGKEEFDTFNIYTTPQGLGFIIDDNGPSFVTSYPVAYYNFKIRYETDDKLTFTVANEPPSMALGAQAYMSRNVTSALVNGFQGSTFTIQWAANTVVNYGLVVEFKSHDSTFAPPGILYRRVVEGDE